MANKRHAIINLGPVTQPGFTQTADLGAFTKAILHLSGTGARCQMMVSPDGGTTWFVLMRPDGTRGRYTMSTALRSYVIPTPPTSFRLSIDTADLVDAWVEGIREVA
jgi:hypothetical protein